ncbi:MAG: transglutaminase [Marinilabiliales bacterium]|nr:MAG: transglutaminase [Marinilabiliales bacterium]
MKKFILSLAAIILLQLSCLAGPGELIKNAGTSKDYPNADYLVVLDKTTVDVQETGLSYNNIQKVYKVLTYEGATHLNHLTFDYDPLSAYIEIKEVTIYRKNGIVEKLGPENYYDYPAPAFMIYWGARQQMVNLGKLEPGDGIDVKYFKKGFTYALLYDENQPDDSKYIPPMRGQFYDIIEYWYSQPLLEKIYEVNVPNTKELHYKFFHGDVSIDKKVMKEKTMYRFSKKNMMPIERESGMVALSDVAPKLLLTTTAEWEDKSLWFYGVNEDFGSFESTSDIDRKVAEILKGAKDEMDSISRLNHWVADNIRYSGISMGEGEGYTLHKGDMTFTDRCGVCKDKAGMLITFLRAAGFESYPAMTMAGSRIEDIPADQFNHSVTIVKLHNGEYMILDPTWVPFVREEWSSLEQQQNYLMGVPEGADLMITPISPPENHPLIITGNTTITEDGTLEGSITVFAEGQSDASLRGMFTRNQKQYWNTALEDELRTISEDIQIIEMNYSDPYGHMESPMHISVKFKIPDYAIITDQEIIFTPIVASNIFKRAQAHLYTNTSVDERKYPFRDRCSRLVELKETIMLPTVTSALYLPIEDDIDGSAASFKGAYILENNQLQLSEEISIKKRLFEPEEWKNYKAVVNAQQKFADEKVILSR